MKSKKLNLQKLSVTSFTTGIVSRHGQAVKGGRAESFNCAPTHDFRCTFEDACFSKGRGCSRWQVC